MIVVKGAVNKENPHSFRYRDASQAGFKAPAQLNFLIGDIARVKGNLDESAHVKE
jgi:hypothetical protein